MRPAQRRPQSHNRRISNVRQRRQQHLLDVKVRSRKAAQHRARKVPGGSFPSGTARSAVRRGLCGNA